MLVLSREVGQINECEEGLGKLGLWSRWTEFIFRLCVWPLMHPKGPVVPV